MPQDIVTLEQVKTHLGLDGGIGSPAVGPYDDNLTMKLEEATVLVLDWVRQRVGSTDDRDEWYAIVDAWDADSAPLQIRAAILRMVGHLFRFRGDDDKTTALTFENGDLPADVTMFLRRLRDPALA